jgi:hypothetical protein
VHRRKIATSRQIASQDDQGNAAAIHLVHGWVATMFAVSGDS